MPDARVSPLSSLAFFILLSVIAASRIPDDRVRIAYHVTVDKSSFPLLPRFLNRILHEDNLYLVDYAPLLPVTQILNSPNIQYRQADPYTQHGVSEVINVLDGMAYFLDREEYLAKPRSFEYFIHCTPAEYPTINSELTQRVLSYDHREYPPPNYFLFTHQSLWPLYSDEIDRIYMDNALTFNRSLDLSAGLIRSQLSHPDKLRRVLKLPRSDKHFVVNYEYVKLAVDSLLSRRLLITLGDTSHVYEHFFAALAYNTKDPIGRLIRSTSLRCRDEKALEVEAHKLMPDYKPLPPTMDMLRNTSKPCLFTGPFDEAHGVALFDQIDHEFLIPPGKQGRDPGEGFHDRVFKMLKSLES